MDAIGGPDLLVRQAVEVYEAQRFVGSNGADIPGSNSVFAFTSITHVAYAAPFKVLGGYWGGEALVRSEGLRRAPTRCACGERPQDARVPGPEVPGDLCNC
jgi:hypothetical protein